MNGDEFFKFTVRMTRDDGYVFNYGANTREDISKIVASIGNVILPGEKIEVIKNEA